MSVEFRLHATESASIIGGSAVTDRIFLIVREDDGTSGSFHFSLAQARKALAQLQGAVAEAEVEIELRDAKARARAALVKDGATDGFTPAGQAAASVISSLRVVESDGPEPPRAA